jgi:dTDP-4-dehydrorhamnose 3,5-epimerase
VQFRELSVPGAWEITPRQFPDDRGVFLEWFKDEAFAAHVGHRLDLQQANCSVSAAGVLRGIHFADVPPGQAKYVTCARGAVLDVVVDIRVGSPTFGAWDSVLLDDVDRRGIYLAEGLGHAFLSLEDDSTVLYLCSTGYAPGREHGIDPLDPAIGIEWPTTARDGSPLTVQLSDKDRVAPGLEQARAEGLLPTLEAVTAYVDGLAGR